MKYFLRLLTLLLFPLSLTAQVPEAVDLGLSVKWASFNLGASKPEDAGSYFAWGETEPKEVYNWLSYRLCEGSEKSFTKYVPMSKAYKNGANGFYDDKSTLELCDDAAAVALHDKWRTPTLAEWQELYDECVWVWAPLNGVNGYKISNKSDATKWIFLPAADSRFGDSPFASAGWGHYWSSTRRNERAISAYDCRFTKGRIGIGRSVERCYGYSVRPVCDR